MFVASSKGDVMENLDLKPAHFSLTELHYKKSGLYQIKDFLNWHSDSKTALFTHKTQNVEENEASFYLCIYIF